MKSVVLVYLFVLSTSHSFGQDALASELTQEKMGEFIPTGKVTWKGYEYVNKGAAKSQNRKMRYMIQYRTKSILYGNACAMEATRSMGFEFTIFELNKPYAWEKRYVFMTNFKTKTFLVLTQGPFWKKRLKKKLRECGALGGDLIY